MCHNLARTGCKACWDIRSKRRLEEDELLGLNWRELVQLESWPLVRRRVSVVQTLVGNSDRFQASLISTVGSVGWGHGQRDQRSLCRPQ